MRIFARFALSLLLLMGAAWADMDQSQLDDFKLFSENLGGLSAYPEFCGISTYQHKALFLEQAQRNMASSDQVALLATLWDNGQLHFNQQLDTAKSDRSSLCQMIHQHIMPEYYLTLNNLGITLPADSK